MVNVRDVFTFPHPVNEYSVRIVAGMVTIVAILTLVLGIFPWGPIVLIGGFAARVFAGSTLCPFAQLSKRVLLPLTGNPYKPQAGPPVRFSQTLGLGFSVASLVCYITISSPVPAYIVLGVLTVVAALQAVVGFCAGCFVFGYLMRWGLVPQSTCERCATFNSSG